MRSELEKIQYIEEYLEGNLSVKKVLEFESELAAYPAFKIEVDTQRKIIETIKKNALFLMLDDIHNEELEKLKYTGKAWWQNIWLNMILISGLITVIGISIMSSPSLEGEGEPDRNFESVISKNEEVKENASIPSEYNMECLSDSTPQQKNFNSETENKIIVESELGKVVNLYSNKATGLSETISGSVAKNGHAEETSSKLNFEDLLPSFDTIFYTQGEVLTHSYFNSKTVINLPNDLIKGAKGGEIFKLLYREYRNAAEMTYAKIPMLHTETGEELRFNSAGMFEFIPLDSTVSMNELAGEKIDVDFELTQNFDG